MNPISKTVAIFACLFAAAASQADQVSFVYGNSSDTYTYRAAPYETFIVEIEGDGDTDVDLYIRAPNGEIVCRSVRPRDRERCAVTAGSRGGRYTVEVRNLGRLPNEVLVSVL